ncbi:ice-binding family protein [Actinokineospora sp. NBRC 105648]|uniref:ice-binding family protein n=1 Tax=Actinokineospora sp. NBRC 105648 TaxID=3032206 RepID=UPI0024A13DF8|nr:ice-binding family protein [Actinokineospora sp. NBRC 105648]GLZ38887.1 hypothetical protein Acsp05_25110 [Actinokineospora sp. NBRC 105648]
MSLSLEPEFTQSGAAPRRWTSLRLPLTLVALCAAALVPAVVHAPSARAQTAAVSLASAANFAVLAATTVTNTGATTVTGDLGVSPGTAITGVSPGQVAGTIHAGDGVAAQAHTDLAAAYGDAAARPVTATISAELGGTTRTPGVYDSAPGTFGITGTLTLDAQGDPNAVFLFKAESTLVTAAGSGVALVGGARASSVFWLVGSSATLGADSQLRGTVLASTSITVSAGVTVLGRLLARDAAITLDTAAITTVGQLSIAADPAADLGSGVPGETLSGKLGPVTVDADGLASWTATVSLSGFTRDGGGQAPVPNTSAGYWSGAADPEVGSGTFTPGQLTAAQAQSLGLARTAFTMRSGSAVTSVTWNPTLVVTVPLSATAGGYTGTVTHSVA